MDGLRRTDLRRAAKKLAKLQSDHGEITEAEGIESTQTPLLRWWWVLAKDG